MPEEVIEQIEKEESASGGVEKPKFGNLHRNISIIKGDKMDNGADDIEKIETEKGDEESPEKVEKPEPPAEESIELPKLEEMKKEELISEYKKLQTKTNELILASKNKAPEEVAKKPELFVSDIKAEGLVAAVRKHSKELGLPPIETVESFFTEKKKDTQSVGEWQKTKLLEEINEKFKIKPEDFEFDPTEQYKDGTPSYYYRTRTVDKESELKAEREARTQTVSKVLKEAKERQQQDLDFLKKTYFNEKEMDLFNAKLKEFDDLPTLLSKGQADLSSDPFAIKNLFRAVHFEFLLKREVDKALAEVHKEYKAKGMTLPGNSRPTDLSKMKAEKENENLNEKKSYGILGSRVKKYTQN